VIGNIYPGPGHIYEISLDVVKIKIVYLVIFLSKSSIYLTMADMFIVYPLSKALDMRYLIQSCHIPDSCMYIHGLETFMRYTFVNQAISTSF
jgi:hypothetical protein